jgi:transcriptional antiterminator RfaH
MTDGTFGLVDGERWYVVYTQPHREVLAEMHLAFQGFRTFLPRHRKTVRHARKLKTVIAPFFPRYLFVALDLRRDRWRSINGTLGVVKLVSGQELPLALPSGVVETMAAARDMNGDMILSNMFAIGDRVRVLSGPFADLIGELAHTDGRARVRVLLRLLGRETSVSIERSALAPALTI